MSKVYYKVQYYDSVSLTWKDIQKQFTDQNDALDHCKTIAGKTRLMHVDGKKREVVTP